MKFGDALVNIFFMVLAAFCGVKLFGSWVGWLCGFVFVAGFGINMVQSLADSKKKKKADAQLQAALDNLKQVLVTSASRVTSAQAKGPVN